MTENTSPSVSGPAIEQYSSINLRLIEIQAYNARKCFIRIPGTISANCWCRKAGPNGSDLPCPPASPV